MTASVLKEAFYKILCVRVKINKLSFEPFCVWILNFIELLPVGARNKITFTRYISLKHVHRLDKKEQIL